MNKSTHLESLTWLRALAAFFVICSHVLRVSGSPFSPKDTAGSFLPFGFLDLGTFGVYLFFSLSGCTLTLSYFNHIFSFQNIRTFYIRRILRIWPAYCASLFLYLGYIEVFKLFHNGVAFFGTGEFLKDYSLSDIIRYLTLTFNITGPDGLFVGLYWSLPVEFQYYMLLPIAFLLMRGKLLALIIPLLIGTLLYYIFAIALIQFSQNEVFKMGFAFFGGASVAIAYKLNPYRLPFLFSLLIFICCIIFTSLVRTDQLVIPERFFFVGIKTNAYGVMAVICTLVALFSKPFSSSNIVTRFLREYGKISYSIYLFHMMFIGVSGLIIAKFNIYGFNQKIAISFFITAIGSYYLSKVTYHYIEKPFLNLGRKKTYVSKGSSLSNDRAHHS